MASVMSVAYERIASSNTARSRSSLLSKYWYTVRSDWCGLVGHVLDGEVLALGPFQQHRGGADQAGAAVDRPLGGRPQRPADDAAVPVGAVHGDVGCRDHGSLRLVVGLSS